jgi:hypothetical protein
MTALLLIATAWPASAVVTALLLGRVIGRAERLVPRPGAAARMAGGPDVLGPPGMAVRPT